MIFHKLYHFIIYMGYKYIKGFFISIKQNKEVILYKIIYIFYSNILANSINLYIFFFSKNNILIFQLNYL